MYQTDHTSVIIKAISGNKEKVVEAYSGCSSKSVDELYSFAEFIDNAAGTRALIEIETSNKP